VKILFCTSNKIGARLIRAVTWSDWSHVCVIDGGEVIEAVYPCVKATPLAEVLASHSSFAIVEIPCDEAAAIRFLRGQIGKDYDTEGMIGIGIHRNWQEDDAWWCSELVAAAIAAGGVVLFRDGCMHRVTPQDLWMLNFNQCGQI
jgi:uncharacterized protein YycO